MKSLIVILFDCSCILSTIAPEWQPCPLIRRLAYWCGPLATGQVSHYNPSLGSQRLQVTQGDQCNLQGYRTGLRMVAEEKKARTEREWISSVTDETPRCLLMSQYLIYCVGTINYLCEIGLVPSTKMASKVALAITFCSDSRFPWRPPSSLSRRRTLPGHQCSRQSLLFPGPSGPRWARVDMLKILLP